MVADLSYGWERVGFPSTIRANQTQFRIEQLFRHTLLTVEPGIPVKPRGEDLESVEARRSHACQGSETDEGRDQVHDLEGKTSDERLETSVAPDLVMRSEVQ